MADFEALVDAAHAAGATRLVDEVRSLFLRKLRLRLAATRSPKPRHARLHAARFLKRVLRASMAVAEATRSSSDSDGRAYSRP